MTSQRSKPDISNLLFKPMLAGIYEFDSDESFVFRVTGHHFLLIHRGRLDGMNGSTPVTAKGQELAYFHPSCKNSYTSPKGTVLQQVIFEIIGTPVRPKPLLLGEVGTVPPVIALGDHFDEMRAMFDIICLELGISGVAHRLESLAAIYRILALLSRLMTPEALYGTHLDSLEWARTRMYEALSVKTHVYKLAREVGMQKDSFIRAFKRRYGLTPRAYNKALLLREAIRLLHESTLSIKQIAMGMGWRDAKSLTDNLRKHCGANAEQIRAGAKYNLDPIHIEGSPRLNIHIVPPGVRRNYIDQWILPGHMDHYSAATADMIATKGITRKK